MACIGQDKLTRDRIRTEGVFSASVVSEALLPAADFCGTHPGYEFDKSEKVESEKGGVLNVPVPKASPWTLELQVDKTLHLDDKKESEIYICTIKNVMAEEYLAGDADFEKRLRQAAPVISVSDKYLSINPAPLGDWGSMG